MNIMHVNAIYYDLDLCETKLNKDEKVDEIIQQTGFTRTKVIDLLNQGSDFREFLSLDKQIFVTDDDEKVQLSETIADFSADPQRLYPKFVFERGFFNALNQLDDEERFIFIKSNDFCMDCLSELSPEKQITYHDISTTLLLHSESAVQQRVRKIEKFLQKELIGEKVVQACVIRFLGTEKLDDGLVRYNYAYRDVLHKGEGIIDNIYDSKTHTFWGADVVEFAETES